MAGTANSATRLKFSKRFLMQAEFCKQPECELKQANRDRIIFLHAKGLA